ncbi:hypothetical protein [Pseudoalteromonas rhizosphaerae]|uniref:hypothetical protein n=1 Tax=Pseudoalteromonas rhizosphaerae TaxID=2518973 RepID=UPI00384E240C
MEQQLSLLDKYFQLYENKNYREKFYEFSYDEIIGHFIECKIYKYDEGELSDRYVINKKLEKIILEIKDSKFKIKLIPLILFLGEECWNDFMEINFFDDINLTLLEDFKSLSFKINFNKINEFSYCYESQQDMINCIEEKEFKAITDFNMNPNMGNYQYNRFIYFIASSFFFDEYCQALDEKDYFTFLFFLSSLEYGEKKEFDKRLKVFDRLINNKDILQIILLEDILMLGGDEGFIFEAIMDFSIKLELWQQFINFYLEYPSRYPQLFKPLSKAINQLGERSLDLLLNGIRINKFTSNEDKKALNSCFLNIPKDEMKKYCLETLFLRWLNFIDSYSDYFGSVILTSIHDLVVDYIRSFQDEKVIIQEIELILNNLEEIDNKWFVNWSEYLNYFYKLMTKLFVYGFAIEKYNLHDLKERISFICIGNPVLKNEKGFRNKTTLQLFEEHII